MTSNVLFSPSFLHPHIPVIPSKDDIRTRTGGNGVAKDKDRVSVTSQDGRWKLGGILFCRWGTCVGILS